MNKEHYKAGVINRSSKINTQINTPQENCAISQKNRKMMQQEACLRATNKITDPSKIEGSEAKN